MTNAGLRLRLLVILALAAIEAGAGGLRKNRQPSPIEQYIGQAEGHDWRHGRPAASPGSLFQPGGRLSDLARDPRAYQLDELVTIVVSDRASAIARGATATTRKQDARNSVTALAGRLSPAGGLANLAALGGEAKLDGQGQTTRETQLTTTLAARVTHVLPNGNLVLEGLKEISVNSERQMVVVRGVCRPQDLSPGNLIRSERLAMLEVRIHGKGVVEDAIRRPFFLYRVLMGLLPF
jgi:flagellar L-ring protein precursor FlgH